MRILLLTLYFYPDLAANSVIMTRLAEALATLGHDVTVVTAFPHYDQNRIWDECRGKLVRRDQHGSMKVYRTYLYVPQRKERILGRLLNYFSFNALSTLVGLLDGPYDVILAPSQKVGRRLTQIFAERQKTSVNQCLSVSNSHFPV